MKNYINSSLFYTVLALLGGLFYREFTKINEFVGHTSLGVVHTHYFMLGMMFFLLLFLLEKNFKFSNAKTKIMVLLYHIGLNMTVIMLIVRGVVQVLNTELSKGADASIAGIAGLGHIILGISLILILLQIKASSEKQ